MAKVNLLDFDQQMLSDYLVSLGEKSFRSTQLLQWMHYFGVSDINAMTNLSKTLREKLIQHTEIILPEILTEQISSDGTHKWLLKLFDNNCIETVFIPEANRGTLCVSSQVGCALNCSFCSTGKQGFSRNLSIAEIIGQLRIAVSQLTKNTGDQSSKITNVVMMGMGEPLLNFDNVVSAMNIMMHDHAYGLSKRRVTLSTSGVVPAMEKLAAISDVSLAVSLHAPNDALRDVLVPINKKYPLSKLMLACKDYFKNKPGRKITFEYVMLAGVNDQKKHAFELIELLKNIPAKINLIPFNPIPMAEYQCSSEKVMNDFQHILMNKGDIITVRRKTRGRDIDAACGQLIGKVKDRTRRQAQYNINNLLIKKANSDYSDI